jgi:hypothetical protein
MTAFLSVWDAIRPYIILAAIILAAVALAVTAASSRSLLGHWLGYRVGAPRDRVAEFQFAHAWRERDERILRGELHAEAERLTAIIERIHGGDVGHCPNCLIGRDDDYLPVLIPCAEHKPAGKHHATAPVYGPEPVVAEPDYIDEWVDEWNRRYSQ